MTGWLDGWLAGTILPQQQHKHNNEANGKEKKKKSAITITCYSYTLHNRFRLYFLLYIWQFVLLFVLKTRARTLWMCDTKESCTRNECSRCSSSHFKRRNHIFGKFAVFRSFARFIFALGFLSLSLFHFAMIRIVLRWRLQFGLADLLTHKWGGLVGQKIFRCFYLALSLLSTVYTPVSCECTRLCIGKSMTIAYGVRYRVYVILEFVNSE